MESDTNTMTRRNQGVGTTDDPFYAGDSLRVVVSVTDDGGGVKNISGASVRWVLADEEGDAPILEKSTDGGGVTITAPTDGVFEVQLDPADTEELRGVYHHEAQLTDAGGDVSTLLTGSFVVRPDSA